MTKEEFSAISINNGLKLIDKEKTMNPQILTGLEKSFENEAIMCLFDESGEIKINNVLLILRPLSYITKPIEQDGEKFVPATNMGGYYSDYPSEVEQDIKSGCISLADALQLIKWHFNLMDESEEFIDVNTLEINPYK